MKLSSAIILFAIHSLAVALPTSPINEARSGVNAAAYAVHQSTDGGETLTRRGSGSPSDSWSGSSPHGPSQGSEMDSQALDRRGGGNGAAYGGHHHNGGPPDGATLARRGGGVNGAAYGGYHHSGGPPEDETHAHQGGGVNGAAYGGHHTGGGPPSDE